MRFASVGNRKGCALPDPMTHISGLGSDFSEASTPGGLAVRRTAEPSATLGCPANWKAYDRFLFRCYLPPPHIDLPETLAVWLTQDRPPGMNPQ